MKEKLFRAWDEENQIMIPAFQCGSKYAEMWMPEMEYIGSKDIHDIMIFESDIIDGDLFDCRLPTRGEIIFYTNLHCWACKNQGGITPLYKIANIKIIGNTCKTPELLK